MFKPIPVEWVTPNVDARDAAERAMMAEMQQLSARKDHRELDRRLSACTSAEERREVWLARYPDLEAVTVHRGTLIAVHYAPAQWAARHFQRGGLDLGTTGIAPVKLCEAKWVGLVLTERGIVEMDPAILRPQR